MKSNETTLKPVDWMGTDVRTLQDGSKETHHHECNACSTKCREADSYCNGCGRKIN